MRLNFEKIVDTLTDEGQGAVYVYSTLSGAGWALEQKLVATSGASNFGNSVTLSNNIIIVGAPEYGEWSVPNYLQQ